MARECVTGSWKLVRKRLDAIVDEDISVQQALRLCLLQIETGKATPQDYLERQPHAYDSKQRLTLGPALAASVESAQRCLHRSAVATQRRRQHQRNAGVRPHLSL